MNKIGFSILVFVLAAAACFVSFRTSAQNAVAVSPHLVISQLYGGGGAAGAPFRNDFVELFNRGTSPVNLNGWSLQYASSSGTNWIVNSLPSATIQPGQYFLIQFESEGAVGSPLPTPDFIAPPVTVNGNTFILNMSRTTAKVALASSTTQLPASPCPIDPTIVDLLGYGSSVSCAEGSSTADFSITTSGRRNGNGCTDTDSNLADFTIGVPSPRNGATPVNVCNLGGSLQAGMQANPSTVAPNNSTLLTVAVIPATSPPSTGINVTGDLVSIGGSATQQFFDNGTNGDVTSGDNVWSYSYSIPANLTGGIRTVFGTATDAQTRTVTVNTNININAPLPDEDPLIFGNPSNATADVANENNYLMVKPQYTLSYNRSRAIPNWTAWRLDSSWVGSADRQDDYRPDSSLPPGWYQVLNEDYSGSGYDRGHMTPSGDRTRSIPDNSATFLMTNIIPQYGPNNQGPWADLEVYSRTLASQGKELYIISGGHGTRATIADGRVTVPDVTWKVVMVLNNGVNDLSRVTRSTRVFGVIMPNRAPVTQGQPWRTYRVTVNAVENLTGYDFFSNVPRGTQEIMERQRDRL